MAEAVMGVGAREGAPRRFYVWMAASCLAVAVLGFMPTYFLPVAKGTFKAEPMVHIHGFILFSWVTFFFVQTWLVAQGKTLAHRAWGMLGVAIVTAMTFIVTAVVSLMTVSMLGAPIARWFLTFLAPPPDPNAPPWPAGLPVVSAPPVFVAVAPALLGDLLLVAAMIYDWRTRGRPHPVYLIGGAILLLIQVTVVPVANSEAWQKIAAAIGHLPG